MISVAQKNIVFQIKLKLKEKSFENFKKGVVDLI